MDELRSQWAALMGDLENPANPMENKGFTDNDVCKMYLVGICPFDLFENTVRHSRVDITLLRNITSVHAKRNTQTNCVPSEYLEERKNRYYGYEEETLHFILPMIDDCDRRVLKGRQRAEEDVACKQTAIDPATVEEAKRIDAEIEKKMQIANDLGMKGEVEESLRVLEEADLLKKNKLEMLEKAGEVSYQSRIKPCDICGALLSASDTDRRLTEHYSGKIHVSYQKLRDMSKLLADYIKDKKPER
ncbi:hypothetical protein X943_002374 [Babesia divergens]|uniref:Uncharacterized protein n=1 Tax=Babesia divergens TaxID=32595 RepID=A0AAD9GJP2_BABDI|nr:hypothetical protein X943_002374 [Babesia divergens]